MTDYSFNASILRGQMADALVGSMEQTPYVLAKVACDISPGTRTFSEFCDLVAELDEDDRTALHLFCESLAEFILANHDEEHSND